MTDLHMDKDSSQNGDGGQSRGKFTSSGFIFAAIGSAVGLGNMWKFPYITGLAAFGRNSCF